MTMKWPLVVKSPGSIEAMMTSPRSRRSASSVRPAEIISPRTPNSAAPSENSDQAVPAPST